MEVFFYIILFIIGTLFGSFYTLAVYRIPKRQDIVHTHSYCPNCKHKLGLLDLFPIFSYIFLGGKCRYCKQKIRPRYLILECLSGLLFITIAYFINLRIETLSLTNVINYIFIALYLTFVILMAGIDKEYRAIDKYVNIYGIVISVMYMIYLCIIGQASIRKYVIYIVLYIIILLLNNRKNEDENRDLYIYGLLVVILVMAVFTGEFVTSISLILVLLALLINLCINKVLTNNKDKSDSKDKSKEISFGFLLGVANILTIIFALVYMYIKSK